MSVKKLYKVIDGKVICGVCNGLGEYLNLDANAVRLLAMLIALFSFGGAVIAYIVMACILPDKTSVY